MEGIRSICALSCGALVAACGLGGPTVQERVAEERSGRLAADPDGTAPALASQVGGSRATARGTVSGFVPPSTGRRVRAIGSTVMLSASLRRALIPTSDFDLIMPPQPGEWLAEHFERGQTYDEFVSFRGNRPDEQRKILYLLPMGVQGNAISVPARSLAELARVYFGLRVDVLSNADIDSLEIRSRTRDAHSQYLTSDILNELEERLPEDAYALIAVTDADLYAAPDWNHVYGHASLRGRVAVMSLARYDPAFYGVEMEAEAARTIIRRRTLTVLAHEVGHMFGLKHCVFFRCVMGGANDLRELDGAPLHACPVCLRKLHEVAKLDPAERYRRLARSLRRVGLADEAKWAQDRFRFVAGERD